MYYVLYGKSAWNPDSVRCKSRDVARTVAREYIADGFYASLWIENADGTADKLHL